jgi:hypothetical protein
VEANGVVSFHSQKYYIINIYICTEMTQLIVTKNTLGTPIFGKETRKNELTFGGCSSTLALCV